MVGVGSEAIDVGEGVEDVVVVDSEREKFRPRRARRQIGSEAMLEDKSLCHCC